MSIAEETIPTRTADEWAMELQARRKGRSDGSEARPVPPSSATEPTSNEREIVHKFTNHIRMFTAKLTQEVDSCRKRLARIFNDDVLLDIRSLPAQLAVECTNTKTEQRERLASLRNEAHQRKVALNAFRDEHALERLPKPHADAFSIFLWISGIVITETMLNASFFASGSERGLLGGAIQAFVISFINVYAAWICGRHCFPKINHMQQNTRIIGIATTLGIVALFLMLNIFAGHYRAALEQDPFAAVIQAVITFKENFLGIRSAQGWLLTGVGLVAATGLTIKIYLSDDPYPGYGDVNRTATRAQEAWEKAQSDFTLMMKRTYESFEQKRRDLTDKLTELELEGRDQLDHAKHLLERYHGTVHEQERLCNHVVKEYRQANTAVRNGSKPPVYFDEPIVLAEQFSNVSVDLKEEEQRFTAMVTRFREFREKDSDGIRQDLLETHNQTILSLPDYFLEQC